MNRSAAADAPTTMPTTNGTTSRSVPKWHDVNGRFAPLVGNDFWPEWWNGRHGGLKIRCSQEREGSNPSSGTADLQKREAVGAPTGSCSRACSHKDPLE